MKVTRVGGTRWFTCTWPCPCPGHVACWSTGTRRDEGTSLLLGRRRLRGERGYSVEVQTHAWCRTHAHYPRRGRAKADPNILHEYLMAWGGVIFREMPWLRAIIWDAAPRWFSQGEEECGVGLCPGWKAAPAASLPTAPAEGWDAGHICLWAERYLPGGREHHPRSQAPPLQCLPLCATPQCSADLVVNY